MDPSISSAKKLHFCASLFSGGVLCCSSIRYQGGGIQYSLPGPPHPIKMHHWYRSLLLTNAEALKTLGPPVQPTLTKSPSVTD